MIKVNALKGKIVACGLKQKDVAKALNLSDRSFRYRLKKGVFNNNEIEVMIDLLNINDPIDIFFAQNVS
jgi:hypothetical protein